MAASPKISVSGIPSESSVDIHEVKKKVKEAANLSVPGRLVRKLSGTEMPPDAAALIQNFSRQSSSSSMWIPERIGKSFSQYPLVCSMIVVDNESFKTRCYSKSVSLLRERLTEGNFGWSDGRNGVAISRSQMRSGSLFLNEHFYLKAVPKFKAAVVDEIKRQLEESRNDLIICVGGSGFRPDDSTPEAMEECVSSPAVTLQHLFVSQSLNHGFDEPIRPVFGINSQTLLINLPDNSDILKRCTAVGGMFWRIIEKIILELREFESTEEETIGSSKNELDIPRGNRPRPKSWCLP